VTISLVGAVALSFSFATLARPAKFLAAVAAGAFLGLYCATWLSESAGPDELSLSTAFDTGEMYHWRTEVGSHLLIAWGAVLGAVLWNIGAGLTKLKGKRH
jgi:hypothetical protein